MAAHLEIPKVERIGFLLITFVGVISLPSVCRASAAQMKLGVIQGWVVDEAGKTIEAATLAPAGLRTGT